MCNFRDDWDDSARYIVFDDIDWTWLPNKKSFFGAQKRFVITGKYMRAKTVNWGKPCIYLCNTLPTFEEPEWYELNTIILNVVNKFY